MLDLMTDQLDERLENARRNLRVAVAMNETNFKRVAEAAGLSRNAVSQFMARRTTLSYSNMLKVCDVLKLPIGLLHQPDGLTPARIRLHRALERLPDHLLEQVLEEANEMARESRQPSGPDMSGME